MKPTLKGLKSDQRGAALVEFMMAFLPLMLTFTCFLQLAQLATARLVVKHAAIIGARAGAVMSNINLNTPEMPQGDSTMAIRFGVLAAMGPWADSMNLVLVQVADTSSCADPYGMVNVTVTASYRCSVPLGGRMVCGLFGFLPAVKTFNQTYSMPHQGARYAERGGASCAPSPAFAGFGGGRSGGGGGGFGGWAPPGIPTSVGGAIGGVAGGVAGGIIPGGVPTSVGGAIGGVAGGIIPGGIPTSVGGAVGGVVGGVAGSVPTRIGGMIPIPIPIPIPTSVPTGAPIGLP